jgi:hypothetical protein
LWNINCKPERDVRVVKYKLQAWVWCMSCEIKTVRPERDVWVMKYKL